MVKRKRRDEQDEERYLLRELRVRELEEKVAELRRYISMENRVEHSLREKVDQLQGKVTKYESGDVVEERDFYRRRLDKLEEALLNQRWFGKVRWPTSHWD